MPGICSKVGVHVSLQQTQSTNFLKTKWSLHWGNLTALRETGENQVYTGVKFFFTDESSFWLSPNGETCNFLNVGSGAKILRSLPCVLGTPWSKRIKKIWNSLRNLQNRLKKKWICFGKGWIWLEKL